VGSKKVHSALPCLHHYSGDYAKLVLSDDFFGKKLEL